MSRKQLDALWSEARDLEHSPAKVAILEQAVQLADALKDVDARYRTREELIEAATFGGVADRALVAFAWCLAQCDKDPDSYPEDDLLWQYKWILNDITEYPTVSLEKIRAMQADFERRLRRNGHGLRSYYELRVSNANAMGFLIEAEKYEKLWRKTKNDEMTDCRACERDRLIGMYLDEEEYAKAIKAAQPILSGKLSCHGVPHTTYPDLIKAYRALGNEKQAEEMFCRGYALVAGNPDFLDTISFYLNYLVRIPDFPRGLSLIERHLQWVAHSYSPNTRMTFYSRTANFFERLATDRPKQRKVRIPSALPIHNDEDRYTPAELTAWFRGESEDIAARFDARNGNDYASWCLASTRADILGLEHPDYEEPNPKPAAAVKKTRKK